MASGINDSAEKAGEYSIVLVSCCSCNKLPQTKRHIFIIETGSFCLSLGLISLSKTLFTIPCHLTPSGLRRSKKRELKLSRTVWGLPSFKSLCARVSFFLFFLLTAFQHMWDFSSLTRDQTWTPCIGRAESYPPGHQGSSPCFLFVGEKKDFSLLGLS